MRKMYILGGVSCAAGFFLMIYQALSSMMTADEIEIKRITLLDIVEAKYLQWVDNLPIDMISNIVNYILSMSLGYLIIGIGILLFIIGGIFEK